MFWHADTGGIDITADIKLLECALIPAGDDCSSEVGCMLLSQARWRKSSAARYYQQQYSGFGKTLVKLCSGIHIRLEALYCRTHEVAISNQGSIIQLKKHIRPYHGFRLSGLFLIFRLLFLSSSWSRCDILPNVLKVFFIVKGHVRS